MRSTWAGGTGEGGGPAGEVDLAVEFAVVFPSGHVIPFNPEPLPCLSCQLTLVSHCPHMTRNVHTVSHNCPTRHSCRGGEREKREGGTRSIGLDWTPPPPPPSPPAAAAAAAAAAVDHSPSPSPAPPAPLFVCCAIDGKRGADFLWPEGLLPVPNPAAPGNTWHHQRSPCPDPQN